MRASWNRISYLKGVDRSCDVNARLDPLPDTSQRQREDTALVINFVIRRSSSRALPLKLRALEPSL